MLECVVPWFDFAALHGQVLIIRMDSDAIPLHSNRRQAFPVFRFALGQQLGEDVIPALFRSLPDNTPFPPLITLCGIPTDVLDVLRRVSATRISRAKFTRGKDTAVLSTPYKAGVPRLPCDKKLGRRGYRRASYKVRAH